ACSVKPLLKAGWPQQVWSGGKPTRQPSRRSTRTTASPTSGEKRSHRQVTKRSTITRCTPGGASRGDLAGRPPGGSFNPGRRHPPKERAGRAAKLVVPMDRLLRTVAATFAALLIGYLVQVRARNGSWAWDIDRGSARLKRALVLYVTPVTLALSFWTLQLELWMLSLPVLGLAAQVLGGVLALGAARWWRMAPAQAGSMFVCGLMSNLHSLGGLVTLLFFGEAGYAVGAGYRISGPAVMFGVGFPMAAAMAGRQGDRPGRRGDWIRRILTDPYVLIPNLGLVTGIILRALGIP